VKRMAAQQSFQAHPDPSRRAVFFHGLTHILRTCRMKPAGRRQQRGETNLVNPQGYEDSPLHRRKSLSISRSSSGKGASFAFLRGLMTIEHCGLRRCRQSRAASRTRLLMRLRTTALPSARGTVNPILGPCSSAVRAQNAVKQEPEYRTPCSYTLRKSEERNRRTLFGKPAIQLPLRADGKSLAALSAPAGQYGPSVLGGHTGPEAMGFRASTIIRLIGTFRHRTPKDQYKPIASACGEMRQISQGVSKGTTKGQRPTEGGVDIMESNSPKITRIAITPETSIR
jgi:hypothetical protein